MRTNEERRERLRKRQIQAIKDQKNMELERKRKIKESHKEASAKNPDFYNRKKKRKSPVEVPEFYPDNISYLKHPIELNWATETTLGDADKNVYGLIAIYKKWGCYLSYRAMSERINFSPHTIMGSVQKLIKWGLAERIPFYRHWEKGKQSGSTLILTGDFSKIGIEEMKYVDGQKNKRKLEKGYDARQDLIDYKMLDETTREKMQKLKLDIGHLRILEQEDIDLDTFIKSGIKAKDIWKLTEPQFSEEILDEIRYSASL